VLGLWLAHGFGLGAPYLEALLSEAALPPLSGLLMGIVLGAIVGAVLLIGDLFFLPYWPQSLREASLKTTTIEIFLASIYGGVNEELLMRLFGVSLLAWLLLFVFHVTVVAFWLAIIIMTIIFGMGHLPALKGTLGTMPPMMIMRSMLLNAPVGLLCGWLFWRYGIESAILAHFFTDIVYHVFGTFVLRRKLSAAFVPVSV
jgi:hypothetical protein